MIAGMKHHTDSALAGRGNRRHTTPSSAAPPHSATSGRIGGTSARRGLKDRIAWVAIGDLQPFPDNPRRHPEEQIARLMRNIERVWTNPILIDETRTVLAGHARLEAAKRLGFTEVPTLIIVGLTAAEKRALVIADNRLPEQAVWDFDLLREHFKELVDLDFDVEMTGFSTGEIDLVLDGKPISTADDPADDLTGLDDGPAVSQAGDVWEIERHRLVCGDALREASYQAAPQGELAQMMVTDPPYNMPINGHAVGRGKTRHREFTMAAGEMSEAAYTAFLASFIGNAVAFSAEGSIHYLFTDWRHLPELLAATRPLYTDWKNLLVWNKSNAGQGSFYRSKHELIGVFKNGAAPHVNNFGLGANGPTAPTCSIIQASTVCTRRGAESSICTRPSSRSPSSPI
jgi:hypothetical protein